MNRMNNVVCILLLALSFAFGGCNPEPEQQSIANIEPSEPVNKPTPYPFTTEAYMTQSPTVAPTYTPGPPTVTPMPSPAIFEQLLQNLNMMKPGDRYKYIDQLTGTQFQHWVGTVRDIPLLDDGYYGVAIEMDQTVNERPDLILTNLEDAVIKSLKKDQTIRFSGTFNGFTNMNGLLDLLAVNKVTIHQ